jgi:hypothetical protein
MSGSPSRALSSPRVLPLVTPLARRSSTIRPRVRAVPERHASPENLRREASIASPLSQLWSSMAHMPQSAKMEATAIVAVSAPP